MGFLIHYMILESAILYVKEEQEKDFEKDFEEAGQYISAVAGYIGHTLHKRLEEKSKYLLSVEWEKLEDHTVGFRKSAGYHEWKRLLHHYYDPFPTVEHYQLVLKNKKEINKKS